MKKHYIEFANYLRDKKDEILANWLEKVKGDQELSAPSQLTRQQFYDHIPEILDSVLEEAECMSDSTMPPFTPKEEFREHGSERWQQGFNLQEIVRDWSHLQHCLQEYIIEYSVEHLRDTPDVATRISAFLSNLVTMGVSSSIKQYDALRTTEASAHLKQLEEAKHDLERRISNNSVLFSATTHDLKGGADMLAKLSSNFSDKVDPSSRELLRVLDSYLVYNQDLLEELHALAKLEAREDAIDCKDFDVSSIIKQVCQAANKAISPDQNLAIAIEGPDKLDIHSDPLKIARILNNLLSNAMKYVESGIVHVMWGILDEKQWELKVIDNGPGLRVRPEEELAKTLTTEKLTPQEAIEENEINTSSSLDCDFKRIDLKKMAVKEHEDVAHFRGNGIGLSVVKRLCEVLNASFEIYSQEGHGVAVFIRFPLRSNED